uniref:Tubulin tyrosine ligase like 4 n=1 Tax=Sphenodon punctatus TaxID=8508 RepID=A0A8D0H950_SPHPU
MASAGPEPYSTGLKGGARIPSSRRLVPPLTERPHESKALDLAQQQVKPIWQLRRKQVKALQDQGPGHSGISPQHSCFSLCSPRPGDAALPSQTLSPPRPLPDLLGSRLLYRQSCFRHKPYQRLEAICLRPSTSRRGQPCFYNPATGSSMSSSATDPLLLPGVAGERSGAGGKASHLGSGKPTSNIYRPVLNNNSFLRPNSAKVPAQPPPEGKKLKSVPKPLAVSWMRSGGNGEDSPLEKRPGKSNGVASLEQTGATSLLSPGQNSVVLGPERHSWHYEAGESKEQSLTEQEIPLTEAVRKLTEGSFRAVHAHRIDNPCLRTLGFHSGLFSGSSRLKPHILAQLTPKDSAAAAPLSVETGSPRLSSKLSLSGTENANVCTKRISVHLLASNPGSSDCSPLSQTVNFLALSNRDQAAKPEPPQLAIVSDVAAQISSIQLGKSPKRGKTALRRDLEDVADLPLLDQGAVEDVEEELPDGLEDSCSQGEEGEEEDDESDASSTAGLSPNGSVALISRSCIECLTQPLGGQERILKPALICSLFPNMPPILYFATRDERVEKLPWDQRKLLRWKMSTVTPNIVKQTIGRSHFKISKKSKDWLGCWGHHMKSPGFRAIKEHQKLNHFPGSFQIGRKDRLWRNLSRMQTRFGKKEFNFFPQSFILPQDMKLLKKAWEESSSRQKWIVKPPASARGIGIQVIHKWSQLPKRRPLLVQRYLHKPYLIGGSKFDLRIYVYVTCYDPLRIYLFRDGLVRFASCKYSPSMKSLGNKFMHLTNYSVNKKNIDYRSNADETACQGHKWALKALWSYLTQKGVNSEAIWEKIKDIVVKTIVASEPYVNSLVKMYVRRPSCCHELFGFDVLLDENLKPWILEVNISPSLHSNSPLDVSIKGQMIRDLLNLAGFVLPNAEDVASAPGSASSSTTSLSSAVKEKVRPPPEQFTAEKMKRAYYLTQKVPDQDFYSTILDILTPEDVRVLVETEDEFSRRGQFERVFPSCLSMRYLRFFEQPRYFNILTAQWELKHYLNKSKGVELLRSWCYKGYHDGTVADTTHVWSLPRSHLFLKSDLHLNGFGKLESGRFSKTLQRDGEEPPKTPEPNLCTPSLPLSKCASGALKKSPAPRTLSHLSAS